MGPRRPGRRAVLAGLAAGLALPGGAAAQLSSSPRPRPRPAPESPQALAEEAQARIAAAGLGGGLSVVVAEAATGRERFAANVGERLPPASTTKAVTAAYAFDTLGPGHRLATEVLATGPVRDGVLRGDLVLAGGGAPGLDSAGLDTLLADAQAAGLRAVEGRLMLWDGALPRIGQVDPGQPPQVPYNPAVAGLNLNYNRVHFGWQRQANGRYGFSFDARTGGLIPPIGFIEMSAADRSWPHYTYAEDAGRERWTVARPRLGPAGARWLPVRDPGRYAGEAFRYLAAQRGLALPAPERLAARPAGRVLARLPGPPMLEIARGMLRFSNNMTAEVLGLAATTAWQGRPEDLAGSAAAMTTWGQGAAGLGAGAALVDHSGLGARSRLSARDLAALMRATGPDGALAQALPTLGLRAQGGGPEPFTLRAKTGTLNFVSALAGHIRRPGRGDLVFAILTGELDRRAAIPRGHEAGPPGTAAWTARSRQMQYDLVRIWSRLP